MNHFFLCLVRRIQFQFLNCFSWLNNGSLQTQGQVIHRNPTWYLHFVIEQNNPPLFYFSWSSNKNDSFFVTLTQPGTKILLLSVWLILWNGSQSKPFTETPTTEADIYHRDVHKNSSCMDELRLNSEDWFQFLDSQDGNWICDKNGTRQTEAIFKGTAWRPEGFSSPLGRKKKRKKETGISNFTFEQKALTFPAMQFVKALPGPISKMCCKELWENCCHTILHKELSGNLWLQLCSRT